MAEERVPIPGSAPEHGAETASLSALPPSHLLTVTIVLRRPPGAPDLSETLLSGESISRDEASRFMEADPSDVEAVKKFADAYDLNVSEVNPASRTVKVTGSVTSLESAFGIRLESSGGARTYSGPLTVPAALAGKIVAVLGLDNRAVARSAHQ